MSLMKINWKKDQLLCFREGLVWVEKLILIDEKGEKKFYINQKTAQKIAKEVGGYAHKCGSKYLILKNEKL